VSGPTVMVTGAVAVRVMLVDGDVDPVVLAGALVLDPVVLAVALVLDAVEVAAACFALPPHAPSASAATSRPGPRALRRR
jgi:hypothetical protein